MFGSLEGVYVSEYSTVSGFGQHLIDLFFVTFLVGWLWSGQLFFCFNGGVDVIGFWFMVCSTGVGSRDLILWSRICVRKFLKRVEFFKVWIHGGVIVFADFHVFGLNDCSGPVYDLIC